MLRNDEPVGAGRVGPLPSDSSAGATPAIDFNGPVDHPFRAFPADWLDHSVFSVLCETATIHADKVALDDGDTFLTYRELRERVEALAAHIAATVGRGAVVGVALPNGTSYPVAMLGVLAAGCAYVPLDLTFPEQRNAYILQHSDMKAIVVDASTRGTIARMNAALPQIELERVRARFGTRTGRRARGRGAHHLYVGQHRQSQGRLFHAARPAAPPDAAHQLVAHVRRRPGAAALCANRVGGAAGYLRAVAERRNALRGRCPAQGAEGGSRSDAARAHHDVPFGAVRVPAPARSVPRRSALFERAQRVPVERPHLLVRCRAVPPALSRPVPLRARDGLERNLRLWPLVHSQRNAARGCAGAGRLRAAGFPDLGRRRCRRARAARRAGRAGDRRPLHLARLLERRRAEPPRLLHRRR